jgi:hypothetical protein
MCVTLHQLKAPVTTTAVLHPLTPVSPPISHVDVIRTVDRSVGNIVERTVRKCVVE